MGALIHNIGEGCVVCSGGIIFTFDGQKHLDVNIYSKRSVDKVQTVLEMNLLNQFNDELELVQFDSHPRGHGSIVNFEEDLGKVYFGRNRDEIQIHVKNNRKEIK